MSQTFSVKAPGKIILSGEHSVVYGAPALAVAINKYIQIAVKEPDNDLITIESPLYNEPVTASYAELIAMHADISERFAKYQQQVLDIDKVIDTPSELIFYVVADFFLQKNIRPTQGLHFHFSHSLPIGCGCGSSAAAISATLMALLHQYKESINSVALRAWTTQIEHLQHGQSSGLDADVIVNGGVRYFNRNQAKDVAKPAIRFYTLASGTPISSTGQCVVHAKAFFYETSLVDEFSQVTDAVYQAVMTQNQDQLIQSIRANHRLLCKLNLVPDSVELMIKTIEKAGGAAKICGAGTLSGQRAGVVLVVGPDNIEQALSTLSLPWQEMKIDEQGCRVVQAHENTAVI